MGNKNLPSGLKQAETSSKYSDKNLSKKKFRKKISHKNNISEKRIVRKKINKKDSQKKCFTKDLAEQIT